MEEGMTSIEYIVVEKRFDGSSVALGTHKFRVPVHVGEYIGIDDENGVGQIYRVFAVGLAADRPVSGGAGDLYVQHSGKETAWRRNLMPPPAP
jgi:hypothetical protein